MHFSEIFIRRPVLSTVLAALITFLGLASVANLPVRQYPEVEESVITITTVYPGAAPDLIQGFVTSPIAAAVSTTENMDYITSQSRPSASVVTVQMKLGADPDIALTEVMSKVQQVRGQLPQDTEDPVIAKGTGRTFALMYLAARNPNMTPEQLNEYLARVIRPRVTNIGMACPDGKSWAADLCDASGPQAVGARRDRIRGSCGDPVAELPRRPARRKTNTSAIPHA